MLLAALTAALFIAWVLFTRPQVMPVGQLPDHEPDAIAGASVFLAGGCASCHASPVGGQRARGEDELRLGGGVELDTPFGTFRGPNISPHREDGIGSWSMIEFVNAMQRGVAPDGRHYYPAFPYPSYARVPTEDVMDLRAYLDTLPAVPGRADDHTLRFPWSVRRGIGLWKRRYLHSRPIVDIDTSDALLARGRELVEGAGHCGECHTPRDRFGGPLTARWLGGAPSLETENRVPNITPAGEDLSEWSAVDIAYYFESGFTPEFDTVGGSMVAVQENLARLRSADRAAMAAYLKAIPPVPEVRASR
jgi:mono/diheme cytochrome c family protein